MSFGGGGRGEYSRSTQLSLAYSPLQINSVILVMTVVSMVRGRKLGGAETEVNTLQLVK